MGRQSNIYDCSVFEVARWLLEFTKATGYDESATYGPDAHGAISRLFETGEAVAVGYAWNVQDVRDSLQETMEAAGEDDLETW